MIPTKAKSESKHYSKYAMHKDSKWNPVCPKVPNIQNSYMQYKETVFRRKRNKDQCQACKGNLQIRTLTCLRCKNKKPFLCLCIYKISIYNYDI